MAVLDLIGTTVPVEQGVKKSWKYGKGETSIATWKGRNTDIAAKYAQLIAVTGGVPTYDTVDLDMGRGMATIIATYAGSQGGVGLPEADDQDPTYELYSNELTVPIWYAPYYETLTIAQVGDVRKALDHGATTVIAAWTDLQDSLFKSILFGTDEYIMTGFVLRETKTVSKRTVAKLDYTDVNRRVTPPEVSTVNAIIGNLPTPTTILGHPPVGGDHSGWIKKAPNLRQFGDNKWQMTTEWWWYYSIHIMYGGTFDPLTA
jgi:hypothetical protein